MSGDVSGRMHTNSPNTVPVHVATIYRICRTVTWMHAPALNIPMLAWGDCTGKVLPNAAGAAFGPFCCKVRLPDCCIACDAPGCDTLCRVLRES